MSKKKIAIVMGSKSDMPVAEKAEKILEKFNIEFDTMVVSAHRNPNRARKFALEAQVNDYGAIIAIAGLAAHLPGVLASMTLVPVIGVPADGGPLKGVDALYSIVQMPPGIPVASVGIGNSRNAALLALQILASNDKEIMDRLVDYRKQFGDD